MDKLFKTLIKPYTNEHVFTHQKFVCDRFGENITVNYLKMHDLMYADREKLFEIIELGVMNLKCVKYIIDCYGKRKFVWTETFNNFCGLKYCCPIRIICSRCTEEVILYMLDVCERCNLETEFVECDGNSVVRTSLLSTICHCISHDWSGYKLCGRVINCVRIMNRTLDIYVRKKLCFDTRYNYRETVLSDKLSYMDRPFMHWVLLWQKPQIIKRVLDIYIERKNNFNAVTFGGIQYYSMCGDNCMYKHLMNSEWEVFE